MDKKTSILIDTDIGGDVDDALALALALNTPQLEIVGITNVYLANAWRAGVTKHMLEVYGREDIPVCTGAEKPLIGWWDETRIPNSSPDYGEYKGEKLPHAADFIIRAVVKACKDLLRESDVLFRMGGDEFMVLCPDTDKAGALICAERMQKAVGDITIVDQKVSFAYGIAYSGEVYKDMDEMLHSADASMYECKKKMHAGR